MENKIVVAEFLFDVKGLTYVSQMHLSPDKYEEIYSAGPEAWYKYFKDKMPSKYKVSNVRFRKLFEYSKNQES